METYVIHVTKLCNANCTYCYEDDKSSEYTWGEIQTFIDKMIEHSTGAFQVEFLGGEPMLSFDHVKKAVEYIKARARQAKGFIITTNGTVLPDDAIEFLKENPDVLMSISLDGHKYANFMRVFKSDNKNTYDVVVDNIKRLQAAGIEVAIHMVTHPYNVAYLSRSIDHLYELGIRKIGVGTVEKTIPLNQNYCERFIYELDLVSRRICEGKYPELTVYELENLKPYSDVRTYLRNETGKVIGESYGRSGDDITGEDFYNVQKCQEKGEVGEVIYRIRKAVYDNHQSRKG